MNEYDVDIYFAKNQIRTDLDVLVQNDYNSTKLNFTFDKTESRVLFKLKNETETVLIAEVKDNELILGPGVLAKSGQYQAEISLYGNDSKLTAQAFLEFNVRSELINTDDIVEPSHEKEILDQLINEVNTLETTVNTNETTRNTNEQVRITNESTRQSNETARSQNEATRQSNEETRVNSEASRVIAENERISTESERVSNETARDNAESARVSNENARISAEATRMQNESTRVSNETERIENETAREKYIDNLKQDVEDGKFDGNGILSFAKTSTTGLVDTYKIVFTDGTSTTLNVTNGKGISSIAKTSTSGLTDTYTITYNDNTTSTFQVINGRGIVSIDLTSTQDNVDTYTISYNDGTTSTYTVTNSTVTNQEFDELKKEVDYYKSTLNALPKVEKEGTSITLDDTGDAPMKLSLGASELEQDTTNGKNKFGKELFDTSLWNVTGTADEFTIQPINSGTTRQSISYDFDSCSFDFTFDYEYLNGQINLRYNNSNAYTLLAIYDKTSGSSNKKITLNGPVDEMFIALYNKDSKITFKKCQLEEGTTHTDYEEFTGGQASPNPGYPQQIHTISGDNEILIGNKNLLRVEDFIRKATTSNRSNSYTTYNNETKILTMSMGDNSPLVEEFKANTVYTIILKYNVSSSKTTNMRVSYTDGTTQNIFVPDSNTISTATNVYKFLTKQSKSVKSIDHNAYGGVKELYIYECGIFEGDVEINDYTPHQEQSLPLNLGVRNLINIYGNYITRSVAKYENIVRENETLSYNTSSPGVAGYLGFVVPIKTGKSYTLSYDGYAMIYIEQLDEVPDSITSYGNRTLTDTTILATKQYLGVYLYCNASKTASVSNLQLEEGPVAHSYSPYGQEPLEYCKIGDYEDEFVYNTTDTSLEIGKWYLKKNIGKVVLDGSESWHRGNNILGNYYFYTETYDKSIMGSSTEIVGLSDKFRTVLISNNVTSNNIQFATSYGRLRIYVKDIAGIEDNADSFKNWLSNHNVIVYYVLATPQYILLNDTLQTQLDNIYKWATSYKDQTNISQENNDLPFVIKASACYDLNKLLTRVETLEAEV